MPGLAEQQRERELLCLPTRQSIPARQITQADPEVGPVRSHGRMAQRKIALPRQQQCIRESEFLPLPAGMQCQFNIPGSRQEFGQQS